MSNIYSYMYMYVYMYISFYFVYCIRGIFRGGLIFANFANHLSRKFSLWFMSICTNESTTKIAKLYSRELKICKNLGQIRENIGVYSMCILCFIALY